MYKRLLTVCILTFCLAAVSFVTIAQSPLEAENQKLSSADGWSKFPTPNANFSNGLVINRYNFEQYQNLLIPEWRESVRLGQFELDVFSGLPVTLKNGLKCCQQNSSEELQITAEGLIDGDLKDIKQILFDTSLDSTTNVKLSGFKLLWNIYSIWQQQALIESPVSIDIISGEQILRSIQADFSLVFPKQINVKDATQQVFRSKLKFREPKLLKDFAWLNFRFNSLDEDALFVYSPIVKKVRELTGSNTSDDIFNSALAFDDLFVWLQKIDTLQVTNIEQATYLVPVAMLRGSTQLTEQSCSSVNPNYKGNETDIFWNYQSKRFPSASAWLPSEAVYIPRKVTRVFLETKNPYHLYGQQILYIDSELGLPIAKVVYDLRGKLWKNILGVYAFPSNQDSAWKFAPEAQVIYDHQKEQATLIRYRNVSYCPGLKSDSILKDFAPQALSNLVKP